MVKKIGNALQPVGQTANHKSRDLFSLRSCRSSSVIFFDFSEGNIAGNWQEFGGIFFGPTDPQNEGFTKFGGNLGASLVGISWLQKIFRAKFVLETCHPKDWRILNRG